LSVKTTTSDPIKTKNVCQQMTFSEFVAEVNRLSRKRCDAINRDSTRLFKAVHVDLSAAMLTSYYTAGLTPAQALNEIWDEPKQ